MATKDIRDRLYTILAALTPVSGTNLTIAPRVPRGAQDYEGYIGIIRMTTGNSTALSAEIARDTMSWTIEILSLPLGIGLDASREDHLYDYRDLILDTLMKYPRLEASGVPLDGVNGVVIQGDRFQESVQYGNTDRASWQVTLQITYSRVRQC